MRKIRTTMAAVNSLLHNTVSALSAERCTQLRFSFVSGSYPKAHFSLFSISWLYTKE